DPVAAHAHGMPSAVPKIEVADDAHALRVGREYHEADAIDAFERERMSSELLIGPQMRALAEQMQIEIGKDRRETVGVLEFDGMVAGLRAAPVRAGGWIEAGREKARPVSGRAG